MARPMFTLTSSGQELLPLAARWATSSSGDVLRRVEDNLRLDNTIPYVHSGKSRSLCVVASKNNEYLASFIADRSARTIDVQIFSLSCRESESSWNSQITLPPIQSPEELELSESRNMSLSAYISNDSRDVLVRWKFGYGTPKTFANTGAGNVWN